MFSVRGAHSDSKLALQRGEGAVEFYRSFNPVDATEMAVARLAVGFTNAAMDSLDQAASPNQPPKAREIELRLGQKSASTAIDLLTLLDKHRGLDRRHVSVGSVNVGTGGRAIVGNIQSSSKHEARPAGTNPKETTNSSQEDEEDA